MVICSMKSYVLKRKLKDLRALEEISKEFEAKAKLNEEEYALIWQFKSRSATLMNVYIVAFNALIFSSFMSLVTYDTRRLLFPGYYPYDFQRNRLIYGLTAFYQWLAWTIQVYSNMFFDTFPGILTFLLNQHLKIFNLRVSKIAYDQDQSQEESHQLLREAIKDHKKILKYHEILNNAVSVTNFVVFLSSSLNVVCCVVLFTFFADKFFQKLYFTMISICYLMETALNCYYGSEFEQHISDITMALYSCNWYDQPKRFKTDLIIFMECSLRKYELLAGGLIPVSKATFVMILRGTFSLFTVLNKMREKFN